jgi:dihydropyrimidinase
MGTLIKGGIVINADIAAPYDVLVEDGKVVVTALDIDPSPDDLVIDGSGLVIMPGFIDMHTNFDLKVKGDSSSDDFESGSASALAGGTTTYVDLISPEHGEDPLVSMERCFEKATTSKADFSFHLTILDASEKSLEVMEKAVKRGISGFKVFQGDSGKEMLSLNQIESIMVKAKSLGAVVFVHSEESKLIEKLQTDEVSKGNLDPIYHAITQPAESEGRAAREIFELVKKTGCPTVIIHISSGMVLDVLRDASEKGYPLFGETCPQYLWLNQKNLNKEWPESALYQCSPPLRDISHLDKLWDGLIYGDLDFISADHRSFNTSTKQAKGKDFTKIPNGLPGVETRFSLIQAGGIAGKRFGFTKLVRLLSSNPARICGLYPRKGAINAGSDADLVIFDPEVFTSLGVDDLKGNCDYSPYEGMFVNGGIIAVMSRGEFVYDGSKLRAKSGRGQFIKRDPISVNTTNSIRTKEHPWVFCQ